MPPAVPTGRVWKYENRISSEGETIDVPVTNLTPDGSGNTFEPIGKYAKIDGITKLNGQFQCGPFQPGKTVTTDCFDQVELYVALTGLQTFLSGLGVDVQKIIGTQHAGAAHPVVAHANATSDLNAWYSPQKDDLTFGTNGDASKGQDKWHLASDADVSVHETGHLILDHINPKLSRSWSGEGRAIHEGFGDALAALRFDDAQISEDFTPFKNRPESKDDGLRVVDNTITLAEAGQEEHKRGQVYSGFLWAVKKRLPLAGRQAADEMLKIVFAHAYQYKTAKPSPRDFVDAVIAGAEALSAAGKLQVDLAKLKTIINEEATKRGFTVVTTPPSPPSPRGHPLATLKDVEKNFSENGLNQFVLIKSATHHGTIMNIYQQQYKTKRLGTVEVEGYGMIERKKPGSTKSEFSVRDVRHLKPNEIDETITYQPDVVYQNVLNRARVNLKNAEQKMTTGELFLKTRTGVSADQRAKLSEWQMDRRIAAEAVMTLERAKMKNGAKTDIVIPYGSNNLHYRFKAGLGYYYVNAKTGTIRFEKDVFVD